LARETGCGIPDLRTLRHGVEAALAAPDRYGQYFVIRRQHKVVGQILLQMLFNDWHDGYVLWIDNVFVVPAFRGRGLFHTLYQHTARIARLDTRIVGFRLQVLATNGAAQRVYRKHSMHPNGYLVMEDFWPQHPAIDDSRNTETYRFSPTEPISSTG